MNLKTGQGFAFIHHVIKRRHKFQLWNHKNKTNIWGMKALRCNYLHEQKHAGEEGPPKRSGEDLDVWMHVRVKRVLLSMKLWMNVELEQTPLQSEENQRRFIYVKQLISAPYKGSHEQYCSVYSPKYNFHLFSDICVNGKRPCGVIIYFSCASQSPNIQS